MLHQTPLAYYGMVALSLGVVVLAWLWQEKRGPGSEQTLDSQQSSEGSNVFDIAPDDECKFIPVSAYKKEQSEEENSDTDERQSGKWDFATEDYGKYLSPKDLQVLEDPRESPSRYRKSSPAPIPALPPQFLLLGKEASCPESRKLDNGP